MGWWTPVLQGENDANLGKLTRRTQRARGASGQEREFIQHRDENDDFATVACDLP